jgi:arsenate reductase (thioredoxin)
MAEGWVRHLSAEGVVVRSGGTEPRHLHPLATRVMQEAGVDIAGQRGKSVLPLTGERFDLVVTLCDTAAASCPPFPRAARCLHRAFEDPSFLAVPGEEEDIDAYRVLRDEIRAFVESILAER